MWNKFKNCMNQFWAWLHSLQCMLVLILTYTVPGIFGMQIGKFGCFWISAAVGYLIYLDYKFRHKEV